MHSRYSKTLYWPTFHRKYIYEVKFQKTIDLNQQIDTFDR